MHLDEFVLSVLIALPDSLSLPMVLSFFPPFVTFTPSLRSRSSLLAGHGDLALLRPHEREK